MFSLMTSQEFIFSNRGAAGRAVVSHIRDLWFESSHQKICIYNGEDEASNGRFCWHNQSFYRPTSLNRARRWFTVITLLYDLCSGLAIFDFVMAHFIIGKIWSDFALQQICTTICFNLRFDISTIFRLFYATKIPH